MDDLSGNLATQKSKENSDRVDIFRQSNEDNFLEVTEKLKASLNSEEKSNKERSIYYFKPDSDAYNTPKEPDPMLL